jgi:hypothetical protein
MSDESFKHAFAELFGFKEVFDTLEDYDRASEDPASFKNSCRGLIQYKMLRGPVLAKDVSMESFQQAPVYHFLSAPLVGPDRDAWEQAIELDAELAADVFAITDSPVGHADAFPSEPFHSECHSKHGLMMTLLLSVIGRRRPLKVIEVGGGFGNMARITHRLGLVDNWTTFDLDFVCDAKAYFLGETCPQLRVNRNQYDPSLGAVNLIDQHHCNTIKRELEPADILIGSEALGTLPLDSFLYYYDALLPLSGHLLYAAPAGASSIEDAGDKMRYIEKIMEPEKKLITRDGQLEMFVFTRHLTTES